MAKIKPVWKTFSEWSSSGYKIRKFSKATWFDGVAKFSDAQVVKYQPLKNSGKFGDFDRESDAEQADYYGISMWGNCG